MWQEREIIRKYKKELKEFEAPLVEAQKELEAQAKRDFNFKGQQKLD